MEKYNLEEKGIEITEKSKYREEEQEEYDKSGDPVKWFNLVFIRFVSKLSLSCS